MSNRYYKNSFYALEQDIVVLYGTVTIGATGAVGTLKGGGIRSITRTGTGAYTIQLGDVNQGTNDTYNRLLAFSYLFWGTTYSGISNIQVNSTTPQTDIAAGQVKILNTIANGTATDPANGSILAFEIEVRNSSVGPFD